MSQLTTLRVDGVCAARNKTRQESISSRWHSGPEVSCAVGRSVYCEISVTLVLVLNLGAKEAGSLSE